MQTAHPHGVMVGREHVLLITRWNSDIIIFIIFSSVFLLSHDKMPSVQQDGTLGLPDVCHPFVLLHFGLHPR